MFKQNILLENSEFKGFFEGLLEKVFRLSKKFVIYLIASGMIKNPKIVTVFLGLYPNFTSCIQTLTYI
jgi:hypothetical protein